MNLQSRQLTGIFHKLQPDLAEGLKILPAGQILCRIVVEAITDMGVWQLKFGDLVVAAKAQ